MPSDPRPDPTSGAPRSPGHHDVTRRGFLRTVGVATAAGLAPGGLGRLAASPLPAETPAEKPAEGWVRELWTSLRPEQKKIMAFPFDHELRTRVANNWNVVDPEAGAIGELYTSDQQEIIRRIFQSLTTEDGWERFQRQMKDDSGGFGNYTCAIFGDPESERFQFLLTGRHLTLRADGNTVENAAFGGPIFYGHAVKFDEDPGHPGNVWWHQGKLANLVFEALDGKQQEKALLRESPADSPETIRLRGAGAELPGIAGSELHDDQKLLLKASLRSLLDMFRKEDVDEVMECLEANGGMDALHMSFYREADLGDDGIWDRWKVEGPAFAWYFRGTPHVHTWLNIKHSAKKPARSVRI